MVATRGGLSAQRTEVSEVCQADRLGHLLGGIADPLGPGRGWLCIVSPPKLCQPLVMNSDINLS